MFEWRCSGVFIVNFELFKTCSSIPIIDFEQVNACWEEEIVSELS